jgi:quinohemoprotein ethanol dehydrogenase
MKLDPVKVSAGHDAYDLHCMLCHGPAATSGGGAPDLRSSPIPLSEAAFRGVVHDGVLQPAGMPKFDELKPGEVEGLRQYIRHQARRALEKERQKPVR